MKIQNAFKGLPLVLTMASSSYATPPNTPFEKDTKKLNVVLIASDDLSISMQTFNNPKVKTPNLDRLAQKGVVFNYAHNQYPLSGPSRASIMTGMRPDRTQVYDLIASFRDSHPNAITIPQLFKNEGYYTARVGKIFHAGVPNDIGMDGHDDPQSWMIKYNPIGRDKTEEQNVINYTPWRGNKNKIGSTLSFLPIDATDDELTDGIVANVAVSLIENTVKWQNKPFFIAAGFYRPHCPYIAPRKYFELYPIDKIELPEQRINDWDNKPEAAKFTNPLNWGLTEKQQKEVLQSYYASITFMDAQVGKILDSIETLGIADNTIIVFWSDHGYNTGHHGQWMKQSLFDQVTRTPLIISIPGMKSNGKKTNNHVEFIDIYPTIAEACGLKVPDLVQGVNLAPILNEVNIEWNRPAFTQVQRTKKTSDSKEKKVFWGRTVRLGDFRYTEWDEGKEGVELYNYAIDPNEFTNLAGNMTYEKEQKKLQKILHKSYKN